MTQATFNDHFSAVAGAYAAARPEYPDALFELIAAHVAATASVWEPGCGSGQATRGLAARFAHVHATDPSVQQIAQHWARHGAANVSLAVEPGERTVLPDASVQLVAVAQALHWFDRGAFFAECQRVLAPGGVLAAWGYGDFVAPESMVDAVADFRALIDPYWPPERELVDAQYAGFDWPFPALPTPLLWLDAEWTLPHFLRYLASMSATARCGAERGEDPVARHAPALAAAWGAAEDVRTIRWPLFLHLRRRPAIDSHPRSR
jgi:SAM-dependent methyltransferase